MRGVRAQEEAGSRGICRSSVRSNFPRFPEELALSCEKNSHKCQEKCLLKELCSVSKNSIEAEKSLRGAGVAAPGALPEEEGVCVLPG